MKHSIYLITHGLAMALSFLFSVTATAHDPVFGIGPHVLFKEGIELHANIAQEKSADASTTEQVFEAKYGITGDWVVGFELPYQQLASNHGDVSGLGDISLSTKYRFWRDDSLAVQESAAVLLKVKLASANSELATNTTDTVVGFAYGYESLKWYRWASIRYRFNQDLNQQNQTIERGDRLLVDFSMGYRAKVNGYRDPDMVYMLELNGEFAQSNNLNQLELADTGGSQWFISPGFMWTLRNMAIKGGVQLPIYNNLHGIQAASDYRVKLSIEWHL